MRFQVLIIAAALGSVGGGACDFIEPGECLYEGEAFGPCMDGTCAPGLYCFTAQTGEICVPPADPAVADDWTTSECAAWVGALLCDEQIGFCFIGCAPSGCEGGTVCDEWTQMCVYPWL
jgi:hypothetical protein